MRVRRRRDHGDPAPAHARPDLGPALVRRDPPVASSSPSACCITGSIWAKGSWGPWWVWDEPMLVSFLIVFLLYATYQPLRFSIEDPERQSRYASVFAIVAGAFVPMNFAAVRMAESFIHPRTLGTTTGGMPGEMMLTFLVALAGMALLFVTLWTLRAGGQAHAAAASARSAPAARRRRAARDRRAPPPRRCTSDARRRGLRRRGVPRLPRAAPDLRRDHGRAPRRAWSASSPSSNELPRSATRPRERRARGDARHERAPAPRRLAQDRAGRGARAPGAARRPAAAGVPRRSSSRRRRSARRS